MRRRRLPSVPHAARRARADVRVRPVPSLPRPAKERVARHHSFELNVDAALEGGPGARPSPELKTWLRAYRDDAERLVLRSVEAAPPAAFTLHDQAPFTHPVNAEADFAKHRPDLFAWMKERYVFAASFGTLRVCLRRDVIARGH